MSESRRVVREMISVSEARDEILGACSAGPVEEVLLRSSVGRVIREDAVADIDIPPFDNSAMDGFAVSLSDLAGVPTVLAVQEDIPAGSWPSRPVGSGFCSRIMTGAPLPEGADAIAPIEWCEGAGESGGTVTILRAPSLGQHVRPRGSDIKKGDLALQAPAVVTPHMIGVLASLGYGAVKVSRRPSVSVVATGDELVDASEFPEQGQIRNSNGPTLASLTIASGAALLGEYLARDDIDHTRQVLEDAMHADIVIISGGVSVGRYDYVKAALDGMGLRRRFWRVRQRPGKPLTFGKIDQKLVFGLPGNPVSTAVCFRQYVLPAIRKTLGLPPGPEWVRARLEDAIVKASGVHFFLPGRASLDATGHLTVAKSGAFGSHIFSSLAAANCLISVPEELQSVEAGSMVDVELFGDL